MIPLLAAGAAISFVGGMYSGYSTYRSSRTQAEQVLQEGRLVYRESLRSAAIVREEGEKFAAQQALAFIGAGFQLGGSGLVNTAQTRKYAETEAVAYEERGLAMMFKSEQQAEQTAREGRAALIGSFLGGAGNALSLYGGATR